MPKSNEGDPRDKTFQIGTDNQGPRSSGEDDAGRTPYDHVVERFKRLIAQEQESNRASGINRSPEQIIRNELFLSAFGHGIDAYDFWNPLMLAWDAVTYNRYGLEAKKGASLDLSNSAKPISLTPYQSSILDAMTDAVGITHQKGQTEIRRPYVDRLLRRKKPESVPKSSKRCLHRVQEAALPFSLPLHDEKDNYRSQQKHS